MDVDLTLWEIATPDITPLYSAWSANPICAVHMTLTMPAEAHTDWERYHPWCFSHDNGQGKWNSLRLRWHGENNLAQNKYAAGDFNQKIFGLFHW